MVANVTAIQALSQIVRREVELYAGEAFKARQFAVLDDEHQIYAVIYIDDDPAHRPAWVSVMARIIGDKVIIEEDRSLDKPLYEALMVNGGVPREKIVLAYKGESLPEDKPDSL